ncbi:FMN-binding negative transcriptional regulator [Paraglaciecola arctica]|uniref:FMN-binding negative transcriptional regulator n=1 Tax=Paraglaciecola arctica TaxID=1128911 RepID=UPI001C06BA9A|nr:FMN-binding negative transcriptional regulator [Paraglaciecola arctica]MBU3001911.1 FMN-binding negative transcriptional regulator [Paraglaciecola arctica]
MFIPNVFKMKSLTNKQKFIDDYGFGVMVSSNGHLSATHLPFILDVNEGEQGSLYAHCARANPHWKNLENDTVLVIFTGPHGYISPSWYIKRPAVPTWNYTAVHAYGRVTLLNSQETLDAVDQLTAKYEPKLLIEKHIVTDQIKHKLLAAIVGFKIELTSIEGKLKLGQNKSEAEQVNIINGLSASSQFEDLALAKYMQARQS